MPGEVEFATKTEQGTQMVTGAIGGGVPFAAGTITGLATWDRGHRAVMR